MLAHQQTHPSPRTIGLAAPLIVKRWRASSEAVFRKSNITTQVVQAAHEGGPYGNQSVALSNIAEVGAESFKWEITPSY